MRIWVQEPPRTIAKNDDLAGLLPGNLAALIPAFEVILRGLPEVVVGFSDYQMTVAVMNPDTHRAIFLMKQSPRFVATPDDAICALNYLRMPNAHKASGEVNTVLVRVRTDEQHEEVT